MSQQPAPDPATGDSTNAHVFGVDDSTPYETQRVIQRYLSQETRHNILQVIIAHPAHLVSLTEFDYYIQKTRSTIAEQLDDLAEHNIITAYPYEPNTNKRDLPAEFWGLTEYGVNLLTEYNYLRGLPVMRAVHDATRKTETIERHETAPRPSLPDPVRDALEYDGPNTDPETDTEQSIEDLREQTLYATTPATETHEQHDENTPLDELF